MSARITNAAELERLFNRALQLQQSGDLDKAAKIYAKILRSVPNHADTHHLVGLIAYQRKQYHVAEKHIIKAIKQQPQNPNFHGNLGIVYKDLGEPEKAIASYKTALTLDGTIAALHNNLGVALQSLSQHTKACSAFEEALRRNAKYPEAHHNWGVSAHHLGQFDAAIGHFKSALALSPQYISAYANLGQTLAQKGEITEAIKTLETAHRLAPQDTGIFKNLVAAFLENDEIEHAITCVKSSLENQPREKELLRTLGNIYATSGQNQKAASSYNDVLLIDELDGEALQALSDVIAPEARPAHTERLETAYRKSRAKTENRMRISYALGDMREKQQDYPNAFSLISEANKIRRATYDYDAKQHTQDIQQLIKTLNASALQAKIPAGFEDKTPIFIIGMPRSGTSLVEQILSSHPKVHGAGELSYLSNILHNNGLRGNEVEFAENFKNTSTDQLRILGEKYVGSLRHKSPNAAFITDKMPTNFLYVGLIKLILPNAKIIHCKRDATDTSWSIFKNNFASDGHKYANDLGELGHFYNDYKDLMTHWHNVFPNNIYDIQYEDLIADQETQTRKLLSHCDLEWDDACLNFYKTQRVVTTTSLSQVRQPIYKSSVKLSQKYGEALRPLLNVLAEK